MDAEDDTTCGGGASCRDHEIDAVQREKLAEKEQKAVTCLRWVLVAALAVSAIVVCVVLYLYTSSKEQKEFESQYDSDVFKVFESLGQQLDLALGAADAFAYKMVSYADSSNTEFPFVTLPNFGAKAAKILSSSVYSYLGTYIVVQNSQRLEWENYTAFHSDWVEDNMEFQKGDPNFHGILPDEAVKLDYLFDNNFEPVPYNDTTDTYISWWQNYPSVAGGFPSYNWITSNSPAFEGPAAHAIATKSVTPTLIINHAVDPTDELQVAAAEIYSAWGSQFIPPDEDPTEPYIHIIYPAVNNVDEVQVSSDSDSPVVAIVTFASYLKGFIRGILPPNSKDIVAVFNNTYGQVFTYRIDGAETIFLGYGDHHETKYNHMARSARLPDLTQQQSGSGFDTYTGLPMDTELSVYDVTIYPSQAMEDRYVTNEPIMLAVGAFLIFLFTSGTFLLYDMYVTRRQRIVKNRALASGAIVNSLFPENVRDKLYEENQAAAEEQPKGGFRSSSLAAQQSVMDPEMPLTMSETSPSGKPIADLFEATSVFFADIVGFTKWSSTRTPTDVFELLEGMYGAFDAIAKRRRVFKVETIGDCYVAVTGIPNPQSEHALILVKFARDCMAKLPEVLSGLAETLGAETLGLNMRVGIHSGPVTAGVLRGEKGRFQLFGDSVNTAARMESNGKPGMIHVSQATADELTRAGKESWLRAREEKITAKGKGLMQTYWVDPSNSPSRMGESMVRASTGEPEPVVAPAGDLYTDEEV